MASEAPHNDSEYDDSELEEETDSDSEAPPMKKLAHADVGRGMSATAPYVGAIASPTDAGTINSAPPAHGLRLEWVHGFRAFDSKSNLVVNSHGQVVYPVAGLVVVYNPVNHTQQHFRGHNDDVRCLAQNPVDRDWVVSGQNATINDGHSAAPYVCVWNTTDFTQCTILTLPKDARAVRSVAFSPDGQFVAVVANDNDHTVSVWDWKSKKQLASKPGDKNPIFQIRWNHVLSAPGVYELVTVGTRHGYFWTFTSATSELKSKRVILGGAFPLQTYNTVTFSESGHACLGGFNGTILLCKVGSGGRALKAYPVSSATGDKAAKVFTLDTYQGGLVAGLSDKTVVVFNSKLAVHKVFNFNAKVTAVHVKGKDLFVGTQASEVFEIKNGLDDSVTGGPVAGRFQPLTSGHRDGELWALAVFADNRRAVTAGEDNSIHLWSFDEHRSTKRGVVNPKAGVAPKVKKAATSSLFPQNQCARAVAISGDETEIAVGTNDGHLAIFATSDLTVRQRVNLNSYSQRKVTGAEGDWIQTIAYSPDGVLLAVGTHGSVIVILDPRNEYRVLSVVKSHHSFISHLDWSRDSKTLRSNDGAYEVLFHDFSTPEKPVQITSKAAVKDTQWATETCPISWSALGCMQQNNGSIVNDVSRDFSRDLIASADDLGRVNLYRYPAPVVGHQYISYHGHSSHVTSVRFTPDGSRLLSTGGHDLALFVWAVEDYAPVTGPHQTHAINK